MKTVSFFLGKSVLYFRATFNRSIRPVTVKNFSYLDMGNLNCHPAYPLVKRILYPSLKINHFYAVYAVLPFARKQIALLFCSGSIEQKPPLQ